MFVVSKATAGDVPDNIELSMTYTDVSKGVAVQLSGAPAAAGDTVAGICLSEYTGPTGSTASASFSPTFPQGPDGSNKVDAVVVPVDRAMLVEASAAGTSALTVGTAYDINATSDGIANTTAQGDFKVVEIADEDESGNTTRVRGFFTDPTGYYV